MAAKPKLSQEQWAEVRAKWENDSRKGFPWLAEEMGLPVSAEALRLRSKTEGWEKQNSKLGKNAESKFQIQEKSNAVVVKKPTETQFDPFDQLTDKQEIFVREYVVDWNATQAAIRAGYSEKTAGGMAYQLLQKTSIQNAIAFLTLPCFGEGSSNIFKPAVLLFVFSPVECYPCQVSFRFAGFCRQR